MVNWIRERTLGHVVVLIFGWIVAVIFATLYLLSAVMHSMAKAHPEGDYLTTIGSGSLWELCFWIVLLAAPPIWLLRTWTRQPPGRSYQ